jgi:hypothetical protein
MVNVIDENVAKFMGDDWSTKFHSVISKTNRLPILKFENEMEEKEFIAVLKQSLNPEQPNFEYKKNGLVYNVYIVQTLQQIRTNPLKFGVSIAAKYLDDWISLLIQEDKAEQLLNDVIFPNNTYVVIGKYSEKKSAQNDRVFRNMRVDYIKSFAELVGNKEQQNTEQQ